MVLNPGTTIKAAVYSNDAMKPTFVMPPRPRRIASSECPELDLYYPYVWLCYWDDCHVPSTSHSTFHRKAIQPHRKQLDKETLPNSSSSAKHMVHSTNNPVPFYTTTTTNTIVPEIRLSMSSLHNTEEDDLDPLHGLGLLHEDLELSDDEDEEKNDTQY
jgi:hypothetical protein